MRRLLRPLGKGAFSASSASQPACVRVSVNRRAAVVRAASSASSACSAGRGFSSSSSRSGGGDWKAKDQNSEASATESKSEGPNNIDRKAHKNRKREKSTANVLALRMKGLEFVRDVTIAEKGVLSESQQALREAEAAYFLALRSRQLNAQVCQDLLDAVRQRGEEVLKTSGIAKADLLNNATPVSPKNFTETTVSFSYLPGQSVMTGTSLIGNAEVPADVPDADLVRKPSKRRPAKWQAPTQAAEAVKPTVKQGVFEFVSMSPTQLPKAVRKQFLEDELSFPVLTSFGGGLHEDIVARSLQLSSSVQMRLGLEGKTTLHTTTNDELMLSKVGLRDGKLILPPEASSLMETDEEDDALFEEDSSDDDEILFVIEDDSDEEGEESLFHALQELPWPQRSASDEMMSLRRCVDSMRETMLSEGIQLAPEMLQSIVEFYSLMEDVAGLRGLLQAMGSEREAFLKVGRQPGAPQLWCSKHVLSNATYYNRVLVRLADLGDVKSAVWAMRYMRQELSLPLDFETTHSVLHAFAKQGNLRGAVTVQKLQHVWQLDDERQTFASLIRAIKEEDRRLGGKTREAEPRAERLQQAWKYFEEGKRHPRRAVVPERQLEDSMVRLLSQWNELRSAYEVVQTSVNEEHRWPGSSRAIVDLKRRLERTRLYSSEERDRFLRKRTCKMTCKSFKL